MSSRRLDIGIASYGSPEKLSRTLQSIESESVTDWRLYVFDNPKDGQHIPEILIGTIEEHPRMSFYRMEENIGYAGAVNKLLETAETEYVAYLDNDVRIQTRGWDEMLCRKLDQFHEIGIIFPNCGAYQIPRDNYQEVMWGVGFAWVVSRLAVSETGLFDQEIGHQEEADYCLRLRMAGYKCAALPDVRVAHDATATTSPASNERIAKGVRNFVDKWCRYFCGKNVNYHSPNVLRWEDWPPNALYLEEYWKRQLGGINDQPEERVMDGQRYDLLKVPRLGGFYRGRII